VTALELLALAGSLSLLAGWRLYATTFATGLALRFNWFDLPQQLHALDVLANPWVLAASGAAALAELFADKIMWLDSAWDSVHTLIRPLGGALLALGVLDPQDPALAVATFLLGGGASLLSHGAKAGTRALVNTSPEPFSNIAVSTAEDVATAGGLWLVAQYPLVAGGVSLALLLLFGAIVWSLWRLIARRLRRKSARQTS
jgi:hypothetical protein